VRSRTCPSKPWFSSRARYSAGVNLERRPSLASLAVLMMAASCGGDGGSESRPDAPSGAPDAAAVTPDGAVVFDAAALVDGGGATNPARLWLAPINGSETNLKLQDHEPPPF